MVMVTFLADDLTGGSDVLAQAHAFGLDAAMVLDPARAKSTQADVVGIAGPARSLGGSAFDRVVREGLRALAPLNAQVLLYKICSTFDSSPTRGSIGRGIELLREVFPDHGPFPVVPAQPFFGRYTAFGQHFGAFDGGVYRLDRHPVMSRHPSTPMHEADLRLVLASQFASGQQPGSIDLTHHESGGFDRAWEQQLTGDHEAFVVDAVTEDHLDRAAEQLWRRSPAVVVGSGGIMAALARTRSRRLRRLTSTETASRGPVLVVSASASRTTGDQIRHAVANGFDEVAIPPECLSADPFGSGGWAEQVLELLKLRRDVVAHTACGPDDPRLGVRPDLDASVVGSAIGLVAAEAARRGLTRDVVVAGGDTSSHALAAAGAGQLRISEQFVTAGPICTTDEESALAGCRLLLKGGQVGPADVFTRFVGQRRSQ
uniref:Four-carbon acid sugar kinase family protein n=1 Tax=Streptomyces sp. NBC_00093 TaxID=2975649 RepID=A0AAU2AK66_9ACTN